MALNMERILRGWICLVAVMAFGSTIQCFVSQSVPARLYTVQPNFVNPLMSRLFGVWTLLAAFVRFFGAAYITCKPIYNLTLVSFIIALGHFLLEVFVYKSGAVEIGVITPILVADRGRNNAGSFIIFLVQRLRDHYRYNLTVFQHRENNISFVQHKCDIFLGCYASEKFLAIYWLLYSGLLCQDHKEQDVVPGDCYDIGVHPLADSPKGGDVTQSRCDQIIRRWNQHPDHRKHWRNTSLRKKRVSHTSQDDCRNKGDRNKVRVALPWQQRRVVLLGTESRDSTDQSYSQFSKVDSL